MATAAIKSRAPRASHNPFHSPPKLKSPITDPTTVDDEVSVVSKSRTRSQATTNVRSSRWTGDFSLPEPPKITIERPM